MPRGPVQVPSCHLWPAATVLHSTSREGHLTLSHEAGPGRPPHVSMGTKRQQVSCRGRKRTKGIAVPWEGPGDGGEDDQSSHLLPSTGHKLSAPLRSERRAGGGGGRCRQSEHHGLLVSRDPKHSREKRVRTRGVRGADKKRVRFENTAGGG